MNGAERKPEAVFGMIDSGVKNLETAALPNYGIAIVCQFSGKLKYTKNEANKYLNVGECLVADLSKGYAFSYDGREETVSAYSVVDGVLVRNILELYDISDGCVVPIPDISSLMIKIQKISGGRISDIKEREELGALYFHAAIANIDKARRDFEKTTRSTAALIKDYIDTHLEGKLQLEDISAVFFVSKTQIFRIFKDSYGVAPMQYFLQKKIELAKQMLSDNEFRISEIAEQLSFTDAKHFSKTFKKFTGELPKNYRRGARVDAHKKKESAPEFSDEAEN